MEMGRKGLVHIIEIPEEKFSDWLTDYRALVARRDAEEDDDTGWSHVK